MKYQVKIQYTNPSHEHVSLRRRVESITRLVEAANEQEALNRAANQQRALGFMIKEAAIVKSDNHAQVTPDPEHDKKKKKIVGNDGEKTDIAASGGVKEGFDPEPKDIAAHLVGKHGKGKVTKDHVDAYEKDRDSNKGIDKEAVMKHVQKMSEDVESVDEAQKKLKPSYWKAEWRLGTQSEVDKNNKKIYDRLSKTDPDKAKKFHDNLMKIRKEEVEQIDEISPGLARKAAAASQVKAIEFSDYSGLSNLHNKEGKKEANRLNRKSDKAMDYIEKRQGQKGVDKVNRMVTRVVGEEVESVEESVATAQKVMDRAKVVANTNPDPKKRFAASGLAQKAMLRTINPTGVNTGITRGGGNKTYRMVTGKVPPYQLTKKTGVSEEVEQIDELKKSTLASYVKRATRDVASASRLQRGYETDAARSEFAPVQRGSEFAAKTMRKLAGKRSRGIARAVDKLAKEEVVTEAEREAGYKMSPAVRKAQAASDALSKREKKPQAGTLAAKKVRNAAEKMVNRAKGNANKIDVEPSIEPGKPNA